LIDKQTDSYMTEKQSNEQRYYDALKRIASRYDTAERIIKNAERDYGLESLEALEYAYDNIQGEAKFAIKGRRRPKV
jgi:hypothetical protein